MLLMRSAYEAVDDLNFIPMVGSNSSQLSPYSTLWHICPVLNEARGFPFAGQISGVLLEAQTERV